MSNEQQAKWDARYSGATTAGEPSRVLSEHAHLLPAQGRALDLACGLGANALFLARFGLDTAGWDISPVAIDHLLATARARALQLDAETRDVVIRPPEPQSFDVICVSYFLDRMLTRDLIHALRPGGLLFYQTFTRNGANSNGPINPAYRLAENELLHLFVPPLKLRAYREDDLSGDPSLGLRGVSWLVAQAGRHLAHGIIR
jgi:SAM-dependent methyltransferase